MAGGDAVEPSRRSRVALVGCTGLLGDLIGRTVREHPALEVVATLDRDALSGPATHPPRLPAADGADAGANAQFDIDIDVDIIVWHEADEADVARWLRETHPAPRVLATLRDGRDASLWELAPQRTELGAISPAVLLETIRTGAALPEPHLGSDPKETTWPNT